VAGLELQHGKLSVIRTRASWYDGERAAAPWRYWSGRPSSHCAASAALDDFPVTVELASTIHERLRG